MQKKKREDALDRINQLIDSGEIEDVIDDADPELLEDLLAGSDSEPVMWVATFENTGYLCLPLHGQTRTRLEWREMGFDPATIHDGWNTPCKCKLVPSIYSEGHANTVAPLVRSKKLDGIKGAKRTARSVLQLDLDKAQAAVAKALESEEGRRILRTLGNLNQ